jgi:broad specificity phosphatase PhoE
VTVWLVRHGETEWSATGRHTGVTDVPLLPRGRAQAEAAGAWLAAAVPSPAVVLASPLARAAETCRLAGFGEQAEPCPDLVEWDYGEYDGLTTDQIREVRPQWTLWTDGVPGGESAADVGRRADRVIERVRGAGGDAVLFSHGHLLRVLSARWVGLPPAGGRLLAMRAGAVSALGWEREVPVVLRWDVLEGLVSR